MLEVIPKPGEMLFMALKMPKFGFWNGFLCLKKML